MWKNNISYFWYFYKLQIIAVLIVAALAGSLLCAALSKKECVLSVMLLDCHTDASGQEMEEELLLAMPSIQKRQSVLVQNDLMFNGTESGSYAMTSLSRFLADVGSQKLDVCGMLEEDFIKYDEAGTFLDLRGALDERVLQELEGNLFVAKDGRIAGIYADALPGLQKYRCYAQENGRGLIGIIYNTERLEAAAWYLRYLAE